MPISSIVITAISYLAGSISKSKGAKTAQDEFSIALWEWIRPIFLTEEATLSKFENKPDDDLNQTAVSVKLEQFIQENPNEKENLIAILSDLEKSDAAKSKVSVNQVHYGSGDNVAGDKLVGR